MVPLLSSIIPRTRRKTARMIAENSIGLLVLPAQPRGASTNSTWEVGKNFRNSRPDKWLNEAYAVGYVREQDTRELRVCATRARGCSGENAKYQHQSMLFRAPPASPMIFPYAHCRLFCDLSSFIFLSFPCHYVHSPSRPALLLRFLRFLQSIYLLRILQCPHTSCINSQAQPA
ncbi:hypothetical protein PTI98_011205 [Pleurotus ostreatus]|nr:hypothetical protein PTI98_011205 [Pleurotus ostreatus]